MMKFAIKWFLVTLALLLATALAHAVAWADILFWKVGWIAKSIALPEEVLLFPTTILPIAPGSTLDGPWFFIPACVINIALWSLLLTWLWTRWRRGKLANNTPDGICQPADGLPKPSA